MEKSFYAMLSEHYDDIFQAKKAALSLITNTVPNKINTSILDLAAGTGNEAIALAKEGYHMVASDNSEFMIKRMKEKIKNLDFPIKVKELDMKDTSHFPPESFNGIYCIGNSFVHLNNKRDMLDVINSCHTCLKPGGSLILQIVNFDNILNNKIGKFPIITNEEKGVTFERFYKLNNNKVHFNMKLTLKNHTTSTVLNNTTVLSPLPKNELISLIELSSFTSYRLFGSFEEQPFTMTSPALVAVLTKDET